MTLVRFLASLGICFFASYIGSALTMPSILTWYTQINKAPFNPPNWIFGPVWTILFLLMGISFYLIWEKGLTNNNIKLAVVLFFLQLVLNVAWSAAFFYYHSPLGAYIVIVALWLSILAMIVSYWPISILAAVLQIPYLLWVSFASILNLFVVLLNR